MRLALFLLPAAFGFAAAQAQDAAQPAAAPTPKPAKVKVRKICRAQQDTGSRMGGATVCKTAEEWAQSDPSCSAPLSASGAAVRSSCGDAAGN